MLEKYSSVATTAAIRGPSRQRSTHSRSSTVASKTPTRAEDAGGAGPHQRRQTSTPFQRLTPIDKRHRNRTVKKRRGSRQPEATEVTSQYGQDNVSASGSGGPKFRLTSGGRRGRLRPLLSRRSRLEIAEMMGRVPVPPSTKIDVKTPENFPKNDIQPQLLERGTTFTSSIVSPEVSAEQRLAPSSFQLHYMPLNLSSSNSGSDLESGVPPSKSSETMISCFHCTALQRTSLRKNLLDKMSDRKTFWLLTSESEPRTSRPLWTSKSSETRASHINFTASSLFRNGQTDKTLASTKSAADFQATGDISQSSPGDEEPKLRRASKNGSGHRRKSEDRLKNVVAVSAISDLDSSPCSSSGHRLDNDVTRLRMNEILRHHDDVDLREFSLFAGADDLAASRNHHHHHHLHRRRRHCHHHHHYHHHHHHEDRPSRIPRPHAGSRRNSSITSFDAGSKLAQSVHLSSSSTVPPQSSSKNRPTTPPAQMVHSSPSQTITATMAPTTASHPATAAVSGKSSRTHKRSASTWEMHQSLADLWTEFQQPS